MKTKVIGNAILAILIVGLVGSGKLVLEEFASGNGCPKILYIPMCVVIFICFLIPLVVHYKRKKHFIYFIFTGIAAGIALIATTLQIMGKGECPKTSLGTPMCYYSLLLFSILIVLKYIGLRLIRINRH